MISSTPSPIIISQPPFFFVHLRDEPEDYVISTEAALSTTTFVFIYYLVRTVACAYLSFAEKSIHQRSKYLRWQEKKRERDKARPRGSSAPANAEFGVLVWIELT